MKTCSKCGIEKELSEFYVAKRAASGYTSACRLCTGMQQAEKRWAAGSKPRLRKPAVAQGFKFCVRCEQVKNTAEFSKFNRANDGLHSWCCACCNKRKEEKRRESGAKQRKPPVDAPEGFKWCPNCKNVLPIDSFKIMRKSKIGRQSWCAECQNASRRAYHAAHPQRHLVYKIERLYKNFSLEKRLALYKQQNGLCYLCGLPMVEFGGASDARSAIDHCHKTGLVRGLAHNRCNMAIGKFNDDPELMRKVADNLEKANRRAELL